MGLFDNVDSAAPTQTQGDSVRGAGRAPIPSSIQNLVIKHAFARKAKSGALGIHVLFEVHDGDHKERDIRITEYVTSGDAKGNKTYYEREGERYNLPGFDLIDSLAKLTCNKGLMSLADEKKTINLYDYDSKTEKPTEVDMFTELIGKGVKACVLHQVQDQRSKNTQTGEYEPNGKTRNVNTIDKFLDPKDGKTVAERDNNIPADFKDKWLTRWDGQVDDQSTEVINQGVKGAPVASGANAEKASLFG